MTSLKISCANFRMNHRVPVGPITRSLCFQSFHFSGVPHLDVDNYRHCLPKQQPIA